MARIPMGDFGQLVPEARRTPTASAAQLDGGLSEAAQRLGRTGMGIATDMIDTRLSAEAKAAAKVAADAEREREKQAARAERVEQLTAHAGIQTGLADLHDEIGNGLATGAMSKDDARKQWSERSQKVIGDNVTKLPPDVGALVNAEMLGLSGRLSNSLEDKIRVKDQKDADAGLMVYKEQMQRFATTDMATAVKQWESVARQSGGQAGWSPEKIEKEVQTFREGVAYTKAYSTLSAARDMKGLQAAENLLNQLPDLDPQRRATLENTIVTRRMALKQDAELAAARSARAAEANFRRAEAAFQTFQAMADKGTVLDPNYVDQVVAQTAGTPYQAGVRAMAQQAVDNGGIAAQPIAQQQAALDTINAQIAREGRSPALDKRKEQLEKVLSGSRADLEKSGGLRAGLERGVIAEIAPLDMRNLQSLPDSIAARVQQADTVGRSWAGATVSPLLPEEADALAGTLGNLAPAARSTAIAALSRAVPPKQMAAIAKQIDGKDRALALSMALGTSGTTSGRYTSELVIKGAQAIKDKGVKLDSSAVTGTRARAAEYLGDALQGKAREDVLDAAALIFAGQEAEGSGDIRRAVRLAIGGDVVERNGRKLPIPAGVEPDKFDQALTSSARRTVGTSKVYVSGKPMEAEQFLQALPGAQLEPVGNGRYTVRAGSALVTTDGKKPLILGVGNVAP
jgi:hypothetical protein